MLTVGDKLPRFKLKATISNDLDTAFDIDDGTGQGKWLGAVLLHLRLQTHWQLIERLAHR